MRNSRNWGPARHASLIVLLLACTSARGADDYGYLDDTDALSIDVEDSLDYDQSEARRFTFDGDLRVGYFSSRQDQRDGGTRDQDDLLARFRYGANYGLSDYARLKARVAVTCSDSDCDPNFDLFPPSTARPGAMNRGDIVLDELYIDVFRREKFDFAVGRMQTRAATRGGVFISSLSRMTSSNVTINWTDGAALRYRADNGWNSTFILQYNDSDGSSMLARAPLDFASSDSRVSAFYSLENRESWGPITQRAIDVTYMPSALQTSLIAGPDREDYLAVVGRLAARWPTKGSDGSFIVSGEIGYAPETQDSATGSGSAGGSAWHLEASWMDVRPGHSVGINLGRAEEGWLLSPSYRPNDASLALRYHWRPAERLQVELQGRWREELELIGGANRKREEFDWRLRVTWRLRSR